VELNSRLKAKRSRRSESLVYVEADPNVAYQDVLEAIDASRILNAKVVLLRTEFK
jgi:biopolymer transport protein ExbD